MPTGLRVSVVSSRSLVCVEPPRLDSGRQRTDARAMSDSLPICMPAEIARKWHELSERRREHLVELYDSGRWKRYYSEGEFVVCMRETVGLSEAWARLVDPARTPAE
jgi:hypothetical protein